jgi:hypothetical protein
LYSKVVSLAAIAALGGGVAHAAVVTLDFEGIGDQVSVGDYYDGDGGPDFGVTFSPNALSIVDRDAGGTGNFANEPTPDTILFFLTGSAATLNYEGGFEDGFSFFYTSTNFTGSINVYDGLDATGDLIASLDLPMTAEGPGDPQGGTGDPLGSFGTFDPIGVSFDGTAKSIDFGGTVNQIGFDNITFGSDRPGEEGGVDPDIVPDPDGVIPLPAGLPLLVGGLAAFGILRRRR